MGPYLKMFSWIPLIMCIVPMIMRSVGILPVLQLLLGELFPTDIRSQSIGFVLASFCASAALNVKSFPQLKHYLGLHGIFFFYGAIGFVTLLWGLKTIPDNRGKSLVK